MPERPIRWTGEANGDDMDFNALLALEEAAKLKALKTKNKKVASQAKTPTETMFIDRLTGLPIGQK